MTERELYKFFGVPQPKGLVRTESYEKTLDRLRDAIEDRAWFALYGEIGTGKTETVYNCIQELNRSTQENMLLVDVFNPERKSYKIGDILRDIVYQAGDETIGTTRATADKSRRMQQVLQIAAAAKANNRTMVLVMDEAHEVHLHTIKAIKRLRDFRWQGRVSPFAIIMLGQMPLRGMIQNDIELAPRVEAQMFSVSTDELSQIAAHYTCGLLSDSDCKEVARRLGRAHAIRMACKEALKQAAWIGKKNLELSDFTFPEVIVAPPVSRRKKTGNGQMDAASLLGMTSAAAGGI